VTKKQSGKLICQPMYFPHRHLGGGTAPLSPFRRSLKLAASPSRASPCDQRGTPHWNPRLICCPNQSKYTYSSARSPLPASKACFHARSPPDAACLTSKKNYHGNISALQKIKKISSIFFGIVQENCFIIGLLKYV
jgi:hypothetical protein